MADRPILFSGPMVRALLEGRKTQTRRIITPQPFSHMPGMWRWEGKISGGQGLFQASEDSMKERLRAHAVRIRPGDRLWVRETLRANSNDQGARWYGYAADGKDVWPQTEWTKDRDNIVSIHMPRWASRLTLLVTDVRVQRVQEISDEDAEAEGCPDCELCGGVGWLNNNPDGGEQCMARGCGDAYVDQFRDLWDSINGKRPGCAWADNPWIVAISFDVIRQNIDAITREAA